MELILGAEGSKDRDNTGPWGGRVPGPDIGMRLGLRRGDKGGSQVVVQPGLGWR